MFGLLNICKPAGITSRDVVDRVQRLVRPDKAGHAGTLDPLASGVLIVCIGPATRLVSLVQEMPKRYDGTFLLGRRSDTDDIEGQVTECPDARPLSRAMIERALPRFVGEIQQRPPDYSAVKVRGQRAYALARQGKRLELRPRPVTIHRLSIRSYDYPELRLSIECGSGTYVRAIGRDLAESLGTGAVMSVLQRTAIGPFDIRDAVEWESLTAEKLPERILPAVYALDGRPRLTLRAERIRDITHGKFLSLPEHGFHGPVAALDDLGELVAVLRPESEHQLRPEVVFRSASPML